MKAQIPISDFFDQNQSGFEMNELAAMVVLKVVVEDYLVGKPIECDSLLAPGILIWNFKAKEIVISQFNHPVILDELRSKTKSFEKEPKI